MWPQRKKITMTEIRSAQDGTSLVVQWPKLHTRNAGDLGSIPGQGTKLLHAQPEPKSVCHKAEKEPCARGKLPHAET